MSRTIKEEHILTLNKHLPSATLTSPPSTTTVNLIITTINHCVSTLHESPSHTFTLDNPKTSTADSTLRIFNTITQLYFNKNDSNNVKNDKSNQ